MRIVLDTNIVVSALLWGGIPYRLIEATSAGTIELYSSPVLVAELAEILGRAHIEKKINEVGSSAEAILSLYAQLARIVSPTDVPRVVPNDPDDDHLIACALSAQADLVVTGDHGVLAIRKHQGIDIVAPATALGRIEAIER